MTRQKKIERDAYIEAVMWSIIYKRPFDYWLDGWAFYTCAWTCQCSVHKVKKIFFEKIYPTQEYKNLEY